MKTIKEILSEMKPASTVEDSYRFRLSQGVVAKDGSFKRTKTVGMAYLRNGQSLYTLRLWTLLEARFYLLPSKHHASIYLALTRESTSSPLSKNKYHWNIVGNGQADAVAGVIRIEFDLFDKPVYMSIFPESQAHSAKLSGPDAPDSVPESSDVAA